MPNIDLNNDKELFVLISEGDESAFRRIFHKYSNILYWHAYKLLNSEFWAEETVQEVFLQVWVNRNLLAKVDQPSAYLYRMTANRAFDKIRKLGTEFKLQYFLENHFYRHDNNELEYKAERIQKELLFEEAIKSLPEQRRIIFRLKYQESFSYEEIAEKLKITKHTVRNQMTSALKNMRDFLLINGNLGILFIWLKFF